MDRRYAADYETRHENTPAGGLELLDRLRASGKPVFLHRPAGAGDAGEVE